MAPNDADPYRTDIADVDLSTPNIARMYDYFLGGSANFAIDRHTSEEFLRVYPGNTAWAQHNRGVLPTVVQRPV